MRHLYLRLPIVLIVFLILYACVDRTNISAESSVKTNCLAHLETDNEIYSRIDSDAVSSIRIFTPH